MNGTSRVVVGVDHSEESLGALEFAVEEAVLRGVGQQDAHHHRSHLPTRDVMTGALSGGIPDDYDDLNGGAM